MFGKPSTNRRTGPRVGGSGSATRSGTSRTAVGSGTRGLASVGKAPPSAVRASGSNEKIKTSTPSEIVKGLSDLDKLEILQQLKKHNEEGTYTVDHFQLMKEIIMDPDLCNVASKNVERLEADESICDGLKSLGLHLGGNVAKALNYEDEDERERDIFKMLKEEDIPQCVKDLRELSVNDEKHFEALMTKKKLESTERRTELCYQVEELLVELENSVIPGLKRAVKKPFNPHELAKGEGASIKMDYEYQQEFMNLLEDLNKSFEQLMQFAWDIESTIDLPSELKYLQEKIALLESKVTEQTVDTINFRKLKTLLDNLSEDRTPKSE